MMPEMWMAMEAMMIRPGEEEEVTKEAIVEEME
jgi:hypothetical protein